MESPQKAPNANESEIVEAKANAQSDEKDRADMIVEVHQKALDDLVNVNSLFTIAVFLGLSFAAPHQHSHGAECDQDPEMPKRLIMYEVASFVCLVLSSLGAKSLKVLLNLENINTEIRTFMPKLQPVFKILLSETWRRILFALSIVCSFVGVILLVLSMTEVIQIRFGKLSSGSYYAIQSTGIHCAIVLAALLLYAPSMVYAVTATAPKRDKKPNTSSK